MAGNMEIELGLCGDIPAVFGEVLEIDNDDLLEIIDGWFLQIS